MKIVLDIDQLLADGEINDAEYQKLQTLSRKATGSLALNILIGFGVVSTVVGGLALLQSWPLALALGLLLCALGVLVLQRARDAWSVFAIIVLLVGTVMTSAAILAIAEGSTPAFLGVSVFCLACAVISRSVLLSILATLSVMGALDALVLYWHASYGLVIVHPAYTIAVFTLLALIAYQISLRVPPDYSRLAIAFARSSLFMVNLGFWVGSLWGDALWTRHDDDKPSWVSAGEAVIPDVAFAIAWAVGLVAVGVWAARANRPWVVNLMAVFGAIHFYTQYFERLGATPVSILLAGLIMIAIAMAIVAYNRSARTDSTRVMD